MILIASDPPRTDPTPIFEIFRGSYATELLVAAASHFDLFGKLARHRMAPDELRGALELCERAFVVLMVAIRALGLVRLDDEGRFTLTDLAVEHLVPGAYFGISDYLGMAAESPGVKEMVKRLRSARPAGVDDGKGAAFIYREGMESAMEQEASARRLTLTLAGRARNVAPVLARNLPLDDARLLLDIGGGTGIYSMAWLQRHPRLRAIVWDRAEVLKVAGEMATAYGVSDRIELRAGDMFVDPVPEGCDVMLLSNVLHDWDVQECQTLVRRCADALPAGGRLLIHDVFLNDAMDGPLPVALYSAALFSVTEGRAYSAGEYRKWLQCAGLNSAAMIPTLVHCGVVSGAKP